MAAGGAGSDDRSDRYSRPQTAWSVRNQQGAVGSRGVSPPVVPGCHRSNLLRAPRFRSPPHTSLRPNWWLGVVSSGGRLPLHATGSGKVLLAYGPGDLLAEVMANSLSRYTPRHGHAGTPTTSPDKDSPRRRRLRERGNVDGQVAVASPMPASPAGAVSLATTVYIPVGAGRHPGSRNSLSKSDS